MDRIPIYARAGAVIPMWPEAPPSTAGHHPAEIELHVFPGEGESILHEDDGLTFDGGFYRTTFTLAGRELQARTEGDGYPEFARERFVVVCEGTRRTVEDREFERDAMTTNWAGNVTYRAARGAAAAHARRAARGSSLPRSNLRVLGSGHTFNHLADADEQLTLDGLPADVVIDDDCVSFNAGLTYGALAEHLEGRAALHNLASLPHISVAGAIATGTHGSGTGNLATAVRALQLVTSTGDIVEAERGDPDFDGMVVHLGRLGVVTRAHARHRAVLRGHPARLRGPELGARPRRVRRRLQRQRLHALGPASTGVAEGPRRAAGDACSTRRPATVERHPIIELDPVNCTRQLGVPGPWWDRLPHFRMGFTPSKGDELQAEYLLPARARRGRHRARCARSTIPGLLVSELRTIARRLAVDEPDVRPRHARRALHVRAGADRRRAARDRGRARALRPASASGQGPSHPGHLRARGGLRALAERLDPRGAFRP